MSSRFEPLGGKPVHEGKLFTVRTETFRHEDGSEVTRDIVRHPGAVAWSRTTASSSTWEEIGKAAEDWEHLVSFYTSPGFTDEEVHVYLATGLSDVSAEAEDDERIEIVTHPLSELDALIDEVRDSKTLIGLLELRRRGA